MHWFSDERDSFGDLYEGLLQKNAEETKRGAGQYFTPRVLVKVLVRLMKPKAGEVIQDPAAGTGGFLIAADKAIREATDDLFTLTPAQQDFQIKRALQGVENVEGVYRLLLMNLHLHGIDSDHLTLADTLGPEGADLTKAWPAALILTNPPFRSRRRTSLARRPHGDEHGLVLSASLRRTLHPRSEAGWTGGGCRA